MTLFENVVKLRGFLGKDAEVPSSEGITDDTYAVLTLCVESGVWWRPANEGYHARRGFASSALALTSAASHAA